MYNILTYTYKHIYIYTYTRSPCCENIYIHIVIHMTWKSICLSIYPSIHPFIWIHSCICVHTCMCIYELFDTIIHTWVHTCIHTNAPDKLSNSLLVARLRLGEYVCTPPCKPLSAQNQEFSNPRNRISTICPFVFWQFSNLLAFVLPPASIALTSLAVHLLMDMPLHLCWNSRCKPLHVIHTCNTGVNDTHQVAVKLFSFKWDASCTCAHAAHIEREKEVATQRLHILNR